jgi:broad specificity phosphatase PhoE
MKIFAIRHGQTNHNLNRVVQGWSDNPLNENGIHQAISMGQYLKAHAYKFDRIVSSPLSRTIHSAEIIQNQMGTCLPIDIEPKFIERDFGVFEGTSVDETMPIIYAKGFKKTGYEHDEALLQRISDAVNTLYQAYPTEDILLSCHSHVTKSLLILSDPLTYNFQTWLNNASMCIFEYDGVTLSTLAYNIEATQK